ncbi:MAG: hypothetical protein KAX55_01655 [Propionivibrio sp.]|nr:hypothetical protein [Propionivibrio sp.]
MRFKRMFIYEFQDTYRKRLAFLRKQQRELSNYPLLADQIAEEQQDVDTEMAERREFFNKQHAQGRIQRALHWRKGRAKLAQYPASVRRQLLAYWKRCSLPADPEYFLTLLHMHDTGRLEMNPPVFRQTEECRQRVRATIERLIGRRAKDPCGKQREWK